MVEVTHNLQSLLDCFSPIHRRPCVILGGGPMPQERLQHVPSCVHLGMPAPAGPLQRTAALAVPLTCTAPKAQSSHWYLGRGDTRLVGSTMAPPGPAPVTAQAVGCTVQAVGTQFLVLLDFTVTTRGCLTHLALGLALLAFIVHLAPSLLRRSPVAQLLCTWRACG